MHQSTAIALAFPLFMALVPAQEGRPPNRVEPDTKPATRPLHADLHRILKNHVRAGLVDYPNIRKADAQALQNYLESLAKLEIDKLPRGDQFAFYINLYNATMIQAVLDHTAKDAKWTPGADDFGVFEEPRVHLRGRTITLNELENKVLRPQFKDPRLHVALVCGARSCPPLLARAYDSADLDQVLDDNLRAFLHDGVLNQIDHEHKTVRLSKILEWYRDDFGGEVGVRKLLQQQFDERVAAYRIEYLEYSWALNTQPLRKGD